MHGTAPFPPVDPIMLAEQQQESPSNDSGSRKACWKVARFPLLLWVILFAIFQLAAPNYLWLADQGDTPFGADFLQEWVGARMLLEREATLLYNTEEFQLRQHDEQALGFSFAPNVYFPPVYPPVHYAAFTPLAFIPYRWAVTIWLGVLIASAIAAAYQIQGIALHHASGTFASPSRRRLLQLSIWFGFFLFPPILASIAIGQKSVLWLLILTLAWKLLLSKRDVWAGVAFGLLSIKPTLFFLLPLVLLRSGNIRFFLGASITVVVIWGSALAMIPQDAWYGFLEAVKGSSNYPSQNGYRFDWSCNLLSLAYAVPVSMQGWFKQSFCLILGLYCLLSCFEIRGRDSLSPDRLLFVIAATFLVSPHAYSYDLCVLLLPVLWIGAMQPRLGLIYYTVFAISIAASTAILDAFSLPVLPILLVGVLCEMRLRLRVARRDREGFFRSSEAFA